MRLRSRGLGRKELVMDFREYEVVREGDEVVVVGTIRDPVNWDFTIRICQDDVAGLTWMALRPTMIGMLIRSFFKRKKSHHWGQELLEHLAEGKRRLAIAQEKAPERAKNCVEPVPTRKPRATRTRPSAAAEASTAESA